MILTLSHWKRCVPKANTYCYDHYNKTQDLLAASSFVQQFQHALQALIVRDMPFLM